MDARIKECAANANKSSKDAPIITYALQTVYAFFLTRDRILYGGQAGS